MIYLRSHLKGAEMEVVILSGKRLQYDKYKTTRVWEIWESEVLMTGWTWFLEVWHRQALDTLWRAEHDLTTVSWRSKGKLGKWRRLGIVELTMSHLGLMKECSENPLYPQMFWESLLYRVAAEILGYLQTSMKYWLKLQHLVLKVTQISDVDIWSQDWVFPSPLKLFPLANT